jgi:hypothetical protein
VEDETRWKDLRPTLEVKAFTVVTDDTTVNANNDEHAILILTATELFYSILLRQFVHELTTSK